MKRNDHDDQRRKTNPDGEGQEREDAALLARIAQAYQAPPLARTQQTRLDADLWERTERTRRRHALFLPTMAAAAIAGLMLWLMLPHVLERIEPGGEPSEFRVAAREPSPPVATDRGAEQADDDSVVVAGAGDVVGEESWEYRVLFSVDPAADEAEDPTDGFPADYRAIDDMFLAG